jgi:hypothetical protein
MENMKNMENMEILKNLETDEKTKLLLSIILSLEKRLTDVENKYESLKKNYMNYMNKCAYCNKYKHDVKEKFINNRNHIISCEECYSNIFF